MSSPLRSSPSLRRASQHTLDASFRFRTTFYRASKLQPGALKGPLCARCYSKNSPKNDGNAKPAPGTENLYGKHGVLSSSGKARSRSNGPKLSPEDEKALDELSQMLLWGLPESSKAELRRAMTAIRAEGIPDEVKSVIAEYRRTGSISLLSSAKIIRIVSKLARKSYDLDNDGEQQFTSSAPRQKGGQHDPGPQDQQQRKENKNQEKQNDQKNSESGFSGFRIGEMKLDNGTFLTAAVAAYLAWSFLVPSENSRDITWQEFRTQFFDLGLVQKLTVLNHNRVKVTLNQEAVKSQFPDSPAARGNSQFYFSIGDVATFERHLDLAHMELGIPSSERIPVSYSQETPWAGILLSYGPTLLLIGSMYFLIRRSAGGASGGSNGIFGMGKSRAKKFNHETDVKVTFKDVAGMDEAKTEIVEFVSFLKEPGMYQKLGAKIPRGAILSGPPGTGKTLLAKATAGESGVPFFSVSGSEFVEMFVGVGASRVRDLFQTARKTTPCIIFIDEIDAVGKSRGKSMAGGGNDEREATLNQILTEMDGFNTSEQVVVLAGTNRHDVLDKALLRPGRFDRHISIDKPTMEGRKQIFAVHLKNIVTKEDPSYLQGRLAALTPGFAGADIANCVNEAALIAARNKAEDVTMVHFEQAIERVIGGLEKKSLVLNPEEKKTVAYHEAGHAICGWYFKYADPLLKVSIIPRGQGALGYAQYLPAGDSYLMTVNQLMDRMAMTLGGRVSEELHFDTVTSGASDDFNKVTRMATAMVTKFGMSNKIGYLYFEDDASQQLHKPFSEETAKNIDSEVRRIVDEAYTQCRDLLTEKKKEVGIIAEELLTKEVLTRDDMVRLLGERPFEDNKDFTKYFGSRGDREGAPEPKPGEAGDPENPTGGPGSGTLGGGIGPTPAAFKRLS